MVTQLPWHSKTAPSKLEDSCLVSYSRVIPSGKCGIRYESTYTDLISDMSVLRALISELVVRPSHSRRSSGSPLA